MPQQLPSPEPSSAPPTPAAAPTRAQPPADAVRDAVVREASIQDLLRITGVPANERQLAGLRARRDELREQLEHATEDRSHIRERLTQGPDAETEQLLKQQLAAASGKVLSLDAAIATTERQIAAAPPELLAATQAVPPPIDMSQFMPQEQAAGVAFSAFGLGIVLTLLISRLRRGRRRGGAASYADPQLQQFQQLGVAVDAIALEVERIGEGQRFVTQLLAERETGPLIPRAARGAGAGPDATIDVPLPRAATPPAARMPTPH